jgi:large subunit ribosomal protein L30
MREIKITLVKSIIDRPEVQKKTVSALGLKKLNSMVVQNDTPQILGMIRKISHLVKIEYIQ